MLACNQREVKLIRYVNKKVKKYESVKRRLNKGMGLEIPRSKLVSEAREGKHVSSFKAGNEQHLHSLSLSPDMENFMTGDEHRISLWNLERQGNPVYNLYEKITKRGQVSDEIITKAKFSTASPMFLYTTSKGAIRICDLRESSSF